MSRYTIHEYVSKVRELNKFKNDNDLLIHPRPERQLGEWAKLILEIGHCPCDPKRLQCPCSRALDEIKVQGYCHCKLFFSKDSNEYKLFIKSIKE